MEREMETCKMRLLWVEFHVQGQRTLVSCGSSGQRLGPEN